MSLQGEEFIRFLVLIIPGFLGMWIYKPFVYRGDEDSVWEKDFIQAAMFALPGYLLIVSLPGLSRMPIALQVVFSLFAVAAVSTAAGILRRRFPNPFYWFAAKDSAGRGLLADTPYGRSVSYICQKLIDQGGLREGYTPVAIVYPIGERERAEVGALAYHTARYNEVVLDTRPPLTLAQIGENDPDINPWCKSVSLDNGLVVEIANIKTEVIDRVYDDCYGTVTASPTDRRASSGAAS
jgi:hypothetical protein